MSNRNLQNNTNETIGSQSRPFRVLLLGQNSVGKSALVVRFITHRYIGEYDPNLERLYTHRTFIDDQCIFYEIFDTAGEVTDQEERLALNERIRWADAYIIVYSVTDRCSYEECTRLKFLITYTRRQASTNKRLLISQVKKSVIALLGNKIDLAVERVVDEKECKELASNLGGDTSSREISVSDGTAHVQNAFHDLYRRVAMATRVTPPKISVNVSNGPSSNQKSKIKYYGTKHVLTRSQSLEQPPPAPPINIPCKGRFRRRERIASISTSCPLYNDSLLRCEEGLLESDESTDHMTGSHSGSELSPKTGHAKRILNAFWNKRH